LTLTVGATLFAHFKFQNSSNPNLPNDVTMFGCFSVFYACLLGMFWGHQKLTRMQAKSAEEERERQKRDIERLRNPRDLG
jgi:hypothetical protein